MSTHVAFSLGRLGWRAFYSQQLTLEDLEAAAPARVASVHRSKLAVLTEMGEVEVTLAGTLLDTDVAVTVGDWVLVATDSPRVTRLLERQSLISRLAAGTGRQIQPIAANLDTLFVVSSCNEDFNPSRLERYLAVAFDAHVEPVIVLTKSDLCTDADRYIGDAARIAPDVAVVALDATQAACAEALLPWLADGQTVACVGSSGVGKSTLVNTLTGAHQATGAIREDDDKGRHTTTSRQLLALPGGAWVIDTPGMRELRLSAIADGVRATFDDIETLAAACRFRDCAHDGDAGCAVIAAVEAGTLDTRRLENYLKLGREAAKAALTLRERRERERHFGRMYRHASRDKRKGRES